MSGALAGNKKHVVVLEINGPKTKAEYDAFVQELQALTRRYDGRVVLKARTKKRGR